MFRGGYFNSQAGHCRSPRRSQSSADLRYNSVGFRLVSVVIDDLDEPDFKSPIQKAVFAVLTVPSADIADAIAGLTPIREQAVPLRLDSDQACVSCFCGNFGGEKQKPPVFIT